MITSTSNHQVKNIIKLQKSGKARQEQGVYLVEGVRMFREIPEKDMVKFYVTEDFLQRYFTELNASAPLDKRNLELRRRFQDRWREGVDYEMIHPSVFRDISDTQTPQGILAVVRQKHYSRENLLGDCILLLENIQDPGNLGTIVRTAEGAGVSGIMMSQDTVDIYNPKVVRSTMGAVFRVPFHYETNLMEGVEWLKAKGIKCFASHLQGTSFYEQNYCRPTCFFIGNEGNGLTAELAAKADVGIKIPMQGQVESLNAATAATVLMYEAMRQKTLYGGSNIRRSERGNRHETMENKGIGEDKL